jgi:transcriptional regulator with XRE-family HTH domain
VFHSTVASTALDRRDLRTRTGRRADDLRRAIGTEIRRLRVDAHLSLRAVAHAGGLTPSHLSEIERGIAEASLATLAAIGDVLGADPSIRLFPTTGPRIHDRFQAPIVEALLRTAHADWKRLVEVPVWRPARGVIDLVLVRQGEIVVATEVQSELRRLEQQIRWGREKAESLPSAEAWPMIAAGRPDQPISQALVHRTTRTNRDLARDFESTLRSAYPGRTAEAIAALRNPAVPWPGATVIWAEVTSTGIARMLDVPPRGVRLGR